MHITFSKKAILILPLLSLSSGIQAMDSVSEHRCTDLVPYFCNDDFLSKIIDSQKQIQQKTEPNQKASFTTLDSDILGHIFTFLDPRDLLSASHINKKTNTLIVYLLKQKPNTSLSQAPTLSQIIFGGNYEESRIKHLLTQLCEKDGSAVEMVINLEKMINSKEINLTSEQQSWVKTELNKRYKRNSNPLARAILILKTIDSKNREDLNYIRDEAIKRDNANMLKILLHYKADPHIKPDSNCAQRTSPLLIAAQQNCIPTLQVLMENGADINDMDYPNNNTYKYTHGESNSKSILHYRKLTPDTFKFLLKHGANIEIQDEDGFTPLAYYVSYRYPAEKPFFAQELLKAGARLSIDTGDKIYSIFWYEGTYRYIDWEGFFKNFFPLCTKKNIPHPNIQFAEDKNTLLHLATRYEAKPEAFDTLKEAGANLNISNAYGNSPVHLAAQEEKYNALKCLLKIGADTNVMNSRKETPLHLTLLWANSSDKNQCISLLVSAKACLNAQNENGNTPLHLVALHPDTYAIQSLLENNANPRIINNDQQTPLHLSLISRTSRKTQPDMSYFGHCELDVKNLCFSKLINAGAPADAKDINGNTALHLAAQYENINAAQILLKDYHADVNALNKEEKSPLHVAAEKNNPQVLEQLLKNNPNINILDAKGWSPLDYARENQNENMVKLLKEHGAHDMRLIRIWTTIQTQSTKYKTSILTGSLVTASLYAAYKGLLPSIPALSSLWAKIPWYRKS